MVEATFGGRSKVSMDEARLIALKLQSLNKDDREWIFSQLDADIQSKLAPLLNELHELGFELDSRLVSTLPTVRVRVHDSNITEGQSNTGTIATIDNASPSQLALVFEQEPPIIFRSLVPLHRWRWMGKFKSKESSASLDMVSQSSYTSTPALTSTAQRALLSVVAKHLEAAAKIGNWHQDDIGIPQMSSDSKRSIRSHLLRFTSWLS